MDGNAFPRLERLIAGLAPTWALERERARMRVERIAVHRQLQARHFEAGSVGRRTANWRTPPTDANEAARGTQFRMTHRARDLYRNDPLARRGVRLLTSAIVGSGIMLQLVDEENRPAADARAKAIRKLWRDWALTPACDPEGQRTFYGIQRLVARTVLMSGECLVRRRRRRISDGLPVPLQLQVLEPDYLDTSKDGDFREVNPQTGAVTLGRNVLGISYDAIGRRRGYWMFREHPGSSRIASGMESVFVPTSEVLHVCDTDRPGQVRGTTMLSTVIMALRDFGEMTDATLFKRKLSNLYAGYVYDPEAPDDPTPGSAKDSDGTELDTIEPGTIDVVPPGKHIQFTDPPDSTDYEPYTRVEQRRISAGMGVAYEGLSNDLKGVSWTSGRIGANYQDGETEDWRWDVVVPQLCDPTFQWFLEAGLLMGIDGAGLRTTWTPPRRQMIDPVREGAAEIKKVRGGLKSLEEVHREYGYETEEVLTQLAANLKRARDLGLVLECDASQDANQDVGADGKAHNSDGDGSGESNA